MPIGGRGGEGVHRRRRGIVAQHPGEDVQENRLAVAAGAVDEEQGVFPHVAGQAVAGDLLQEALQPLVAEGDLVEEAVPQRSVG